MNLKATDLTVSCEHPMRYAIYYLPEPDDPLWAFGSSVLGYDAVTGADLPHPYVTTIEPQRMALLTRGPRVYGFHATLKAPFRLRREMSEEELLAAAEAFASAHAAVSIGELAIAPLNSFLALLPRRQSRELTAFAGACVSWFDHLRAPMTEEERGSRLRLPLSPRQTQLLDRWGYPYVFDMFRFHMTLTGKLDREEAENLANDLAELHSPLVGPRSISSICVCVQAHGTRFGVLRRFPLTGSGTADRG